MSLRLLALGGVLWATAASATSPVLPAGVEACLERLRAEEAAQQEAADDGAAPAPEIADEGVASENAEDAAAGADALPVEDVVVDDAAADEAEDDQAALPLVGTYCGELVEAFAATPWEELIREPRVEELIADQLEELIELAGRRPEAPPGPQIELGALDSILRDLPAFDRLKPLSLWDRFWLWVSSWFTDEDGEVLDWLAEWLGGFSISESWSRLIFRLSLLALVVTAVAVVMNELRAAGFFAGGRGRPGVAPLPSPAPAGEAGLVGFASLPIEEQPAALLGLLADSMRRRGVSIPSSATHREILGRLGLLDAELRDAFARVSDSAERIAYADWKPAPAEIEPLLARALRSLEAMRAPTDGAVR